jgi:phenylalanyl-tRNA synthetase alpha chain
VTSESLYNQIQERLAQGEDITSLRQEVLGRKGLLTQALRQVGQLPAEERAAAGSAYQKVKKRIEALLETGSTSTSEISTTFIDPTVPALPRSFGTIHPVSAMIEEMVGIFARLSFEVVEGPELISDRENFEDLNIGADHPARDGHDSFYLTDNLLLRTQTTAVQVLEMRKRLKDSRLPIRVVVPGKTYRRESDQTHSPMFHQIDAVMVDTQTTFADLKGCLQYFTEQLFGDSVEARFRPHHFPFTEPSAELDIRFKNGDPREGKHAGWLEMGGCGMIHPDVLKRAGLNPKIYQGWAFGMSVERPIMVRQGVNDLRRFYDNSLTFLEQFPSL